MSLTTESKAPPNTLGVILAIAVIATLFCVCFFISPPPGMTPSGARPWSEESLLKALCDAMAFDYQIPTPNGFEVKDLAFGVACGVVVIVVAFGVLAGRRSREHEFTIHEESQPQPDSALTRQVDHLLAAEMIFVGYIVLSFISILWAPMKDLAFGGSAILFGYGLWVFALRFGLSTRVCKPVAIGMVVVLSLAAAVGLWYFYERNWTLRMGYPIGNPLFFAACMIPAVMLCVVWALESIQKVLHGRSVGWLQLTLCVISLTLVLWGVYNAFPRSTYIGLAAGAAALVFFAVRGVFAKLFVVCGVAVAGLLAAVFFFAPLVEARSETCLRLYAWDYGYQLFSAAPLLGHGQGAYPLLADALAVQDVDDDPRPLQDWVDHAHNEWIEVMVDLGSVGVVLVLGSLLFTILVGMRVLRENEDPSLRWLMIGLLAAVVGMLTEECLDNALRVAGLPVVFYTVLGLIWALAASTTPRRALIAIPAKSRLLPVSTALVVLLGLGQLSFAIRDFQAARALFVLTEKLKQNLWEDAQLQAQIAATRRLGPTRILTARLNQAGCHLRIAQAHFQDYAQRFSSADPTDMEFERLQRAAQQHALRGTEQADLAIQYAEALTGQASHFLGAHAIAGGAYQLLAQYAYHLGDQQLAAQHTAQARAAFLKEWQRRPFRQDVVATLVLLTPDMPLAEAIELICRPLRYHQVGRRFHDMVQLLSRRPGFQHEFQPILAGALSTLIPGSEASGNVTFPAEKLRLAAWLASWEGRFEDASSYARSALTLAEPCRERFPISPAIISLELAYYNFLKEPQHPELAIEISQQGLTYLPRSHEAEPVRERMNDRLRLYHLALNDEARARQMLLDLQDATAVTVNARLVNDYAILCQLMWSLNPQHRPEHFEKWLKRFYDLTHTVPTSQANLLTSVQLLAEYAYATGDLEGCLALLSEASKSGADVQRVMQFLERIVKEHPGHEPARMLLNALQSQFPQGPAPTPAPGN